MYGGKSGCHNSGTYFGLIMPAHLNFNLGNQQFTSLLPFLIMVQWKMSPSNNSFLSFRVVFHQTILWRKSRKNSILRVDYPKLMCQSLWASRTAGGQKQPQPPGGDAGVGHGSWNESCKKRCFFYTVYWGATRKIWIPFNSYCKGWVLEQMV